MRFAEWIALGDSEYIFGQEKVDASTAESVCHMFGGIRFTSSLEVIIDIKNMLTAEGRIK